mgnify:CR=1 FL=1
MNQNADLSKDYKMEPEIKNEIKNENKSFFRYPAVKIHIREIELGQYIEEKEQNMNYLLTLNYEKLFRVNIISTIVHKELRGTMTDILVDDGTGKIILHFFEENKAVFGLEVGDVVLTIGKIRKYNQEKYIFPELIKKINPLWLKTRSNELKRHLSAEIAVAPMQNTIQNIKQKIILPVSDQQKQPETNEEEIIEEEIDNNPLLPVQKLSRLIAELDKGEGVFIEEIIERSPLDKTEELLEKMLENGDIFQNLLGKVRIL